MHLNQRVQIAPFYDRWMMGDRYGEIVNLYVARIGTEMAKVKMDKSGKVCQFPQDHLTEI
jgi:hypothetical protein